MTLQAKGYPFELHIPEQNGGGVVLVDQVKCVDWRRRMLGRKGRVPPDVLDAVVARLAELIA